MSKKNTLLFSEGGRHQKAAFTECFHLEQKRPPPFATPPDRRPATWERISGSKTGHEKSAPPFVAPRPPQGPAAPHPKQQFFVFLKRKLFWNLVFVLKQQSFRSWNIGTWRHTYFLALHFVTEFFAILNCLSDLVAISIIPFGDSFISR